MFIEYILLAKYFMVCLLIATILYVLPFIFVFQKPEIEKFSTYECGFNPFGDARNKFEIKFYLICVLFLIFDLEISFLFPFVISLYEISFNGVIAMLFFLSILTLGFWYE
jgi:NADH-quinone oxidoreductase subunit A